MKIDKIKTHLKEHKKFYVGLGVGVGIAGITYLIVRDYSQTNIKHSTSVLAKGSTSIFGKNLTLNNVSYFSANRQGPPSWVVRCLETGEVFICFHPIKKCHNHVR